MSNYGNIDLGVEIETRSAKQSLSDLEKTVKKVFADAPTGTEKNLKSIQSHVKQTEKNIENLKQKLHSLDSGETKAKSIINMEKQVISLEKELKKATSDYLELEARANVLASKNIQAPGVSGVHGGVESGELTALNVEMDSSARKIGRLQDKIKSLRNELESVKANPQLSSEAKNYTKQLNEANAELAKQKNLLSQLGTEQSSIGDNAITTTNRVVNSVGANTNRISRFISRISSLIKSALVFSVVTKAFTSLREIFGSVVMQSEVTRNALYQLQAALWVAFTPIYEYIAPAINTLISLLTKAVLYIAAFFNGLSGKTLKQGIKNAKQLNAQTEAYKKIASSAGKATESTKGVGSAIRKTAEDTKEANKELATFDELIQIGDKLDEINSNSGGGGVSVSVPGMAEGFDSLESLLSSSDMENLEKFQKWVIDNKDSIKTALEIAGLGALGLGIGGVITKIGTMLGLFNKKDKALDKQTGKTNSEAVAVEGLANAFAFVPSAASEMVPSLDRVTDAQKALNPELESGAEKAKGLAPSLDGVTASGYALSPSLDEVTQKGKLTAPALDGVGVAAQGAKKDIEDTMVATDALSPAFDRLKAKVDVTMPAVDSTIASAMSNAKSNVNTFAVGSDGDVSAWASNTSQNVERASTNIAENIYRAFSSAGDNIATWVSSSSANISSWASNVTENVARAASNMASNIASACQSMWDNFKESMSAMGEKVVGFFKKNGATLAKATIIGGAIALKYYLAPYTGGASLMFPTVPAFANGAVLPPNKPFLAMVGDQKSGTNIETPLSTMIEAFETALSKGDYRQQGDVVLNINGREFARATIGYFEGESRRKGTKLVTGGAH